MIEKKPKKMTQKQAVIELMRDGEWHQLHKLEDTIWGMGIAISGSGLSATIRQLRKAGTGMDVISREPPPGSNTWSYRLVFLDGTNQGNLFEMPSKTKVRLTKQDKVDALNALRAGYRELTDPKDRHAIERLAAWLKKGLK